MIERSSQNDYLHRIGLEYPESLDWETLGRLQRHHLETIPFENLSPLLGDRVCLEHDSLLEKLVERRRGGYCFENNGAFFLLLKSLGFETYRVLGRVVMGRTADASAAQTHQVNIVFLDGKRWLMDVGFGGMCPTQPLDIDSVEPVECEFASFKLAPYDSGFLLSCNTRGVWEPLYRFGTDPALEIDMEVGNWYVSTHPNSLFTQNLLVSRIADDMRYTLSNDELSTYPKKGEPIKVKLEDASAIAEKLRELFLIDTGSLPGIHERIDRLLRST